MVSAPRGLFTLKDYMTALTMSIIVKTYIAACLVPHPVLTYEHSMHNPPKKESKILKEKAAIAESCEAATTNLLKIPKG